MATREVAALSWAKVENTLKLATLSSAAMVTWVQPLSPGRRKLRPRTRHTANSASPPASVLVVRMVNGGTSLSAMRMIGQVTPQTQHNTTSIRRAPVSAPLAASVTGSGFLTAVSRCLRSGTEEPVENLLAGPEQDVLFLADVLDDLAEIFYAMRRAHDVGMDRDRHHAGRVGGIGIDLLELVERAVGIFRRLVVLDQHHGDVVAFLRIGHVHDRLAAGFQPYRLIVEHPVGDIVVAFLDQEIGRLPGFGEAGAEPAARRLAGGLQDRLARFADVGALVRHLLHVALGKAVAHELPFALERGAHDRRIGLKCRAIDGDDAGNGELVEHFDEAPEADPVAE